MLAQRARRGRNLPNIPFCVYSVLMTYEQLVDLLQNRMRMSHVYQPVMLMTLLQQGGRCSTTEIARSILAHGLRREQLAQQPERPAFARRDVQGATASLRGLHASPPSVPSCSML